MKNELPGLNQIDLSKVFVDFLGSPSQYDLQQEELTHDLSDYIGWRSLPHKPTVKKEEPEEELFIPDMTKIQFEPKKSGVLPKLDMNLKQAIDNWTGIDYKYGGNSRSGLDCSAFTSNVFRELGITIPRGSIGQYRSSREVRRDQVRPGDLIFLKGTQSDRASYLPSHVAIVTDVSDIDNGNITVAQAGRTGTKTQDGVKWNIDKGYYANHFLGFRRI